MQPQRRSATLPARLKKREVPAVFDLFALDARAEDSEDRDEDSRSSVSSHAMSRASSFASLDAASQADTMPYVERGGSWPSRTGSWPSMGGSWPRGWAGAVRLRARARALE